MARLRPLFVLVLAVLVLGAAAAPSASAGSRSIGPAAVKRSGTVVFSMRGVDPRSVRGAVVRAGVRRKRLSLSRVRRGAKRGYLRVKLRRSRGRSRAASRRRVRLHLRLRAVAKRTIPAGALYVAGNGSDSNPGSQAQPWRTLEHASATAPAGSTVVLRAGTYGARGRILRLARKDLRVEGDRAGPKPRVLGQVRLDAAGVTVSGVIFDGPTGGVANSSSANPGGEDVQVWMRADRTAILDSEVRNNRWHAGVFVSEGADQVRIAGNHIHDNGGFGIPAQANLDHGVYFASGSGRVTDNRIEHNLSYGIQLYPSAHDVVVADNTIERHGRGGIIVADRARKNAIVRNQVRNNRVGIRTHDLSGAGNVARDNHVSGNWEANFGEIAGLALLP